MKTVRKRLTVGKQHQGLDLYCTINLDGEPVQRFRSRSFVGGFAWILQSLMNSGWDKKLGHRTTATDFRDYSNHIGNNSYGIGSSNEETPMEISIGGARLLDFFIDKDEPDPNYIWICGAPAHNGVYRGVLTGNTTVELYHLDGTPVDGSLGSAAGGFCNPAIGFVYRSIKASNSERTGAYMTTMFQNWQVIVGKSDKPVSVEDLYLWDRILHGSDDGQISHGNISFNPQVTDKPTSRFTISKPFTNLANEDLEIREIGILASMVRPGNPGYQEGDGQGFLVVRDTLDSPVAIPTGKTLTIDYELVVRLSPDTQDTDSGGTNGGFLAIFMNRLWDIAMNYNFHHSDYFSCATGSGASSHAKDESYRSDKYGLRLGDDNQFVSMTDMKLNINDNDRNGIEHGEQPGQLYHYATDVGQVSYDLAGNKASYVVSRIFENRTAQPITVKEMGLFGNTGAGTHQSSWGHSLLARTAFAPEDQFIIPSGEYIKVEYQIEVIA